MTSTRTWVNPRRQLGEVPGALIGATSGSVHDDFAHYDFEAGRYVHWAPSVPTPNEHPDWMGVEPVIGPPHNRMWVSVAQAVGWETSAVGSTSIETVDGEEIDLTGPLDRV